MRDQNTWMGGIGGGVKPVPEAPGVRVPENSLLAAGEVDQSGGYGPDRLADAVFWLAHGDAGRRLILPRTLEIVLAAGLLGELAVGETKRIMLWRGRGHRADAPDQVAVCEREPPSDRLSAYVYEQIRSDPYQDLGTWLGALRSISVNRVRTRLGLAPASLGRRTRVPTGQEADKPWAALTLRLCRLDPLSEADAFLVALGTAAGLRTHLLEGSGPRVHAHADHAVDRLSGLLTQVVGQASAAIAKDALRPRG